MKKTSNTKIWESLACCLSHSSLSLLLIFSLLAVYPLGATHPPPLQKYFSYVQPPATTGPVSLTYASYFGQSINNSFNDVVTDAAGNIYAFGATINQGFDGVLVKFDPAGQVLWQQYLGGTDAENFNPDANEDYGKLTIDDAGNIYVTGITSSTDFPIINAFQSIKSGGIDAYITKFDSDGNMLLSSYLGGAGDEQLGGAGGIAVDNSGNIFVAGSTTGSAFFTTL